jgi:hypothetical protein
MNKIIEVIFNTRFNFVKIGFILFLTFLTFPFSFYTNPGYGLDPSWMIAINMAVKKGFVFGEDFLFTYGPLGFLATRLPMYIHWIVYVVFDLYLFLNLLLAFGWIMKKYNSWTAFTITMVIIVLFGDFHDHDIVTVLTWLMLFMLFLHYREHKNYLLFNAAIMTTLIFYIKVNLGLITVFIFLVYLGFLLITRVLTKKYLGYFTLVFSVLFIASSFILKVNLIQYVIGSIHLIGGYNDAMYEPAPNLLSNSTFISGVFVFFLCIILLLLNIRIILSNYFLLFISLVILLLYFVMFKQGFVRLHTEGFFQFITIFVAFLSLFTSGLFRKGANFVLLLTLFICYLNQGSISLFFGHDFIIDRVEHMKAYYRQIKSYNDPPLLSSITPKVPNALVEKMKGSVDIIPWDIANLYYTGLDYNPRPVIQSYAAYDAYLDQKNAEKYNGSLAPDNILIKHESIDDRYPLFDETKTKLSILQHYEVSNSSLWNHLLLKRMERPLDMRTENLSEGNARFSDFVAIENTDDLQILYADVEYSLLGKLQRLLYQPPQLFITLVAEDGTAQTFKAIVPILKGGVIINKFIPPSDNYEEMETFITFNGALNKRIVQYKIHSSTQYGFKSDFKVKLEKIKFNPVQKSNDLYASVLIKETDLVPTNNVDYNVEVLRNNFTYAAVSGWASPKESMTEPYTIYAIAKSSEQTYVFPTQPTYRENASALENSRNSSGFKAMIYNRFIRDGNYQLGLMLRSKSNVLVQFTDRHLRFSHENHTAASVKPLIEGGIRLNVENLTEDDKIIDIKGWAFLEAEDNLESKIYIVFKSEFSTKIFPAETVLRTDVSEYFHRGDLNNSGFRARIEKNNLVSKFYSVGILIEKGDRKMFLLTDKTVKK